MSLFDDPDAIDPTDLARIRAAGFWPYSGKGTVNGYWQRAGDPKVRTTDQVLEILGSQDADNKGGAS